MPVRFPWSIVIQLLISHPALPADVRYQLRELGAKVLPLAVAEPTDSISLEIKDRVWVNPGIGGDSSSSAHDSESEIGTEWYHTELAFIEEAFHVTRGNGWPFGKPVVESTHWIERSLLPLTREMFYARELPPPEFSPVLCERLNRRDHDKPSPLDLL